MQPYRVFLSSGAKDSHIAKALMAHLQELGLKPFDFTNALPGGDYSEQLKRAIMSAHIFMPVMTARSLQRGWVHEEIGFAAGNGVPVLPVLIGEVRGGGLLGIQALCLAEDLGDLSAQLTPQALDEFVEHMKRTGLPRYTLGASPMAGLEQVSDSAGLLGKWRLDGRIRESSALSCFSLPEAPEGSVIWSQCFGQEGASRATQKLCRSVRLSLEAHARKAGCDLLLCPQAALGALDLPRWRARLGVLRDFLKKMPEGSVRVAFRPAPPHEARLLMGDFVIARRFGGVLPEAYTETFVTNHAFAVFRQVELFDAEFEQYASTGGHGADERCHILAALERIEEQGEEAQTPPPRRPRVFVSSKSEDYGYAEEISEALAQNGLDVFFSEKSLPRIGDSAYRKAIVAELERADHLVVVASSKEHVDSKWVSFEWGLFVDEQLAGRKEGNIVNVTVDPFQPKDLPLEIRHHQAVPFGPEAVPTLLQYLH